MSAIESALDAIELALVRGEVTGNHVAYELLGLRPAVASSSGMIHDPDCHAVAGRRYRAPVFARYVTCRHCRRLWMDRGWL